MSRQLRRDSFGRRSLMRDTVDNATGKLDCCWCGTHKVRLYKYWWESDGLMRSVNEREQRFSLPFCGIKCYDAYYAK